MVFLSLGAFSLCDSTVAREKTWQPVTDYSISFPGDRLDAGPAINPFENFTHFGTDFGWMGPGQERIDSQAGVIRTKPDGEWTGAWHSLAGLALEANRMFDPTDVVGLGGPQDKRAGILAVTVDARGSGQLRMELADSGKMVRWSGTVILVPGQRTRHRFDVTAGDLGPLKFMNWVAEPGSAVEISSIGFEVEKPEISPEEWLFRISLGKLRRCHDPAWGLTRDRAHTPSGTFDSISSSGLHALASAAGVREGVLDKEIVAGEIRKTTEAILGMPKAAGFFPHFARRSAAGVPEIFPGTEYSTVDTAIALHALRLAATILELQDVSAAIGQAVTDLDFDALTDSEGWIGHGFYDDGTTPLANQWRDWGGETALVLTLESMNTARQAKGKMEQGGKVFMGVAFIPEIESLFYPDFDREEPDQVSGVVWPTARRELFERQASYVVEQWPDSAAARGGIFGLSGGEAGMPGAGYAANGVERPGIRWLHPHAMVMALALSSRDNFPIGIKKLESAGILFPQGLPENVEIGLQLHNPMQGSLNAGFESLAAYHGWRRGHNDVIDEASMQDPMLRAGIHRFWPDTRP